MRLLLALILCGFFPASSLQAAELLKGDAPGWIEDTALPEVDPELLPYAGEGIYYLLSEEQDYWQGERRFSHERIAVKVLSRAGLESAASFLRNFDPGTETLTLTRLDILRDGKKISMRDRVAVEILRREAGLEDGLLDGIQTAHLEVPGLQVGDVLDAGFLWQSDPVFAGQTFSGSFEHEYSAPVGLVRLVLNWPADRPIRIGPDLAGMARSDQIIDGIHRIELSQSAHPPIEPEDNLLPEADPWNAVYFTAAQSWAEVIAPFADHYSVARPVPKAWEAEVAAIVQTAKDDPTRAFAALRLVQDKVRYVGVEVGAGGYFSRDPAQVVENGYGDCKDKSVLLVTVLRALGLEADVALANLDRGFGLGEHLPMVGAFDHMIVRVVVGGKPVWMDGTGSYQAGESADAASPDLGFALPVTGQLAGQLVPILPDQPGENLITTQETFTFTPDGLELDVTSSFKGAAADHMRWIVASTASHTLQQRYLDYYERSYPGIERREAAEMTDAPASNHLVLRESYVLPALALEDQDLTADFPFLADGFDDLLPDVDAASRTEPIYFEPHAERVHQVTVVNSPKALTAPEPLLIDAPAFGFGFEGHVDVKGTLHLLWHFTPRARSVAARDAEKLVDDADQMRSATRQSWDVTRDKGFLATLFDTLKAPAATGAPTP